MPSTYGVVHVVDTIGPRLDAMLLTMAGRVAITMEQGAQEIQAHAQANAPWSDITGMARSGLTATVDVGDGEVEIVLAHSVDYGIWLETIQAGEYAIIMPTLETLGPEIIHRAGGVVMDVEGLVV